MRRFNELDAVLDHCWHYIAAAAAEAQHPFRTPALSTVGADGPDVRTVVLRAVDPEARTLTFHSDRRASKVDDLRLNDAIMWHGWDAERSQQLRLRGTGSVHTEDDVADALWAHSTLEERTLYVRPATPGRRVERPRSGLASGVHSEPLTEADVAPGRKHFAAIRTTITSIQWLHLHPEGHYRARFRWTGDRFEGNWIIP
ncbi:MAG: pyridoxamine 5'-phosphate oxidase [Bacteroidetes bacterium]|jgi:pyridoxine/pyridoxamine 5'-phosphate oxidase|nr:pyridoxamine 5'-phosphate oxidase [Bacteroidota bacterium]